MTYRPRRRRRSHYRYCGTQPTPADPRVKPIADALVSLGSLILKSTALRLADVDAVTANQELKPDERDFEVKTLVAVIAVFLCELQD